jgi:hypothetical protein
VVLFSPQLRDRVHAGPDDDDTVLRVKFHVVRDADAS